MADLIAVVFPSEEKAEEVREKILAMQKDYLIDIGDAVIATKNANGRVKLSQLMNTTAAGAAGGSFWGLLVGLLFLNPLLGVAVGAGAGAVAGALTDVGVDDKFMKGLAAADLQGGQAILFVLVKSVTGDKVLDQLRGVGGPCCRPRSTTPARRRCARRSPARPPQRRAEPPGRDRGRRNLRRPAAFATAPPEEERTMFWTASRLGDFELEATDGPIGAIRDCLFDDRSWKVRWFVADTGPGHRPQGADRARPPPGRHRRPAGTTPHAHPRPGEGEPALRRRGRDLPRVRGGRRRALRRGGLLDRPRTRPAPRGPAEPALGRRPARLSHRGRGRADRPRRQS